jgi:hypothetical protein
MSWGRPLLASFETTPAGNCGLCSDAFVDPLTGLLHRMGSPVPLIEEMLEQAADTSMVSTSLTDGDEDPVDPDLVRFGSPLTSPVTRTESDPQDPDLVRMFAHVQPETLLTEQAKDQEDRDLVREGGVELALHVTQLTKVDGEATDPDLIRVHTRYASDLLTSLTVGKSDQIDPDLIRHGVGSSDV